MKITERVKNKLQSWLEIIPATEQSMTIMENTDFLTDVHRAQMWYRGDSEELSQFFRQLVTNGASSLFWACAPQTRKIRRIHSGLPAIIADTLAYIVYSDMDDFDFEKSEQSSKWDKITDITKDGVDFVSLVGQCVADTLVEGDGAFKISVDTELSPYPLCEYIGAERVEYEQTRGVITAVIFRTRYTCNNAVYTLCERYSKGKIESHLYNYSGNEVSLETCPQLAGIKPVIEFEGDYIMACPLKFYGSKKFAGRGKSIFDGGKSDCFDALDEVISQWWDAVRQGRVKQYIPSSMIPKDAKTGANLIPNSFENDYISTEQPLIEGVAPKIEVVQPDIKYEAFVTAYTKAVLMCLQGLVSPATLGIDVGKMSSADAQREKKDVTGNTRNTITTALEKCLPQLVSAMLKTYDNMQNNAPQDVDVTVSFGEYGAPSFDSRVETVGKASTYGVMSVETQVDELWGSSKDDEWKAGEVKRILSEKGIEQIEQGGSSSVGDELA